MGAIVHVISVDLQQIRPSHRNNLVFAVEKLFMSQLASENKALSLIAGSKHKSLVNSKRESLWICFFSFLFFWPNRKPWRRRYRTSVSYISENAYLVHSITVSWIFSPCKQKEIQHHDQGVESTLNFKFKNRWIELASDKLIWTKAIRQAKHALYMETHQWFW